ncbi:hypothetical protein R3P38DRAFT_3497868 [Favolaschia claudopus]|uniref:Uncharacterized protein n=1 Tax=Favolaschia claudopus TaxID=2862362 RepID=A0AAV9Z3Q6_9AGAR
MHAALSLSSLNHFPAATQRMLEKACTPHPSPPDIEPFLLFMFGVRRNGNLKVLLPVYHCLLDPVRIPTASALDCAMQDAFPTIRLSLLVLEVLTVVDVPPQSGEDLWPRVLVWVEFFQLFREFFGLFDLGIPSEEDLCLSFLLFSQRMCEHAPNIPMVVSSPGFASIATRAWVQLVHRQDISRLEDGLHEGLALILQATDTFTIVEEAGDPVSIVAAHLQLIVPEVVPALSNGALHLLEFVLGLWQRMQQAPDRNSGRVSRSLPLISPDLVRAVTIAFGATALNAACSSRAVFVAERCLATLSLVFTPQSIPKFSITLILQKGTLCVAWAQSLTGNVQEAWATFCETFGVATAVSRSIETQGSSRWACDNVGVRDTDIAAVKCGHIQPKAQFSANDSTGRGGIANIVSCIEPRVEYPLTRYARRFLRAVVHADYQSQQTQIGHQLAVKWVENPIVDLITVFDYRNGEVKASVHGLQVPDVNDGHLPASHWPDLLARAIASKGAFSLHFAMLPDGSAGRLVSVPLRSATSEFRDGLRKIALTGVVNVEHISAFVSTIDDADLHC